MWMLYITNTIGVLRKGGPYLAQKIREGFAQCEVFHKKRSWIGRREVEGHFQEESNMKPEFLLCAYGTISPQSTRINHSTWWLWKQLKLLQHWGEWRHLDCQTRVHNESYNDDKLPLIWTLIRRGLFWSKLMSDMKKFRFSFPPQIHVSFPYKCMCIF